MQDRHNCPNRVEIFFGSWAWASPVISLFKFFFENHIYEFQKYIKKNPEVDNNLSHKCAKYQFQILCSFGYIKMINVWI
jgi:hypothetical protein